MGEELAPHDDIDVSAMTRIFLEQGEDVISDVIRDAGEVLKTKVP